MKKIVSNYIAQMGGTHSYSGKTHTMYVKSVTSGISSDDIQEAILQRFGYNLPFKLAE